MKKMKEAIFAASHNAGRVLGGVGLASVTGIASAADYTGLTIDVTGLDVAAVGIATTMLGVLAVFWGLRKIMSLV